MKIMYHPVVKVEKPSIFPRAVKLGQNMYATPLLPKAKASERGAPSNRISALFQTRTVHPRDGRVQDDTSHRKSVDHRVRETEANE